MSNTALVRKNKQKNPKKVIFTFQNNPVPKI